MENGGLTGNNIRESLSLGFIDVGIMELVMHCIWVHFILGVNIKG
jgi:hypothetical protein